MLAQGLDFREGSAADLATTYALAKRAMHDTAVRQGVLEPNAFPPTDAEIRHDWERERSLIEFAAAQPGGCYWICENEDGPIGYARVVRFGEMEELTELMVVADHQDKGIGRALLERCWPATPTPELGRVVIAAGRPSDLSLYTHFGVMPITGHWHLRVPTETYIERRSQETRDATLQSVHVLAADRASEEWKRLEPPAIGHQRPRLHEFFGRDRTCLACFDKASGDATGLCWVSTAGDIGPAVGAEPEDLVPVMLAALDRVAKTKEPSQLSVFATTISWWLLRRLRALGFKVYWPSWVMCSVPLPGLDRYVPTRPPRLL